MSLKWWGTSLCLVGIALTSFNIYPWNIFLGLVGSALWAKAGWDADDVPLFLVEAAAVVMYIAGVVALILK